MKKNRSSGVYAIINEKTGRRYIGSSKRIELRLSDHEKKLERSEHENKELQKDYDSGDAFQYVILREVPVNDRRELFKAEKAEIEKAKREGISLYNVQRMTGNYYLTRSGIEKEFVDLFCLEHFGMKSCYFFGRSEAGYNMLYEIFKNPEKEQEIREKYEPIIRYQNQSNYSKRTGGQKNVERIIGGTKKGSKKA